MAQISIKVGAANYLLHLGISGSAMPLTPTKDKIVVNAICAPLYASFGSIASLRVWNPVKRPPGVNCCQFRSTTKESFSIVNHCSNMG